MQYALATVLGPGLQLRGPVVVVDEQLGIGEAERRDGAAGGVATSISRSAASRRA
jgi:hypothetical protein